MEIKIQEIRTLRLDKNQLRNYGQIKNNNLPY